ncbi:ribosome maturation factor RimM [Nitrosomonas sp. HPC101]|uniref:ribosome maturation factor RimM n=1 Tax=Nitrosomonas sp. HPC101 TaxID=1658667 RepID=UPI001368C986|nr:ribosome maturation factor RimM [Nitrosomonas sp. HPC101]MXS86182.1 ribosome maturation factor RimM [Nitrosomonas sp. HPC101]
MVVLGKVIGSHGIRGQIKVAPFTEYIDGLMEYTSWWLGNDEKSWQIVHPTAFSIHNNQLVITLEEYNDRTRASELKGLLIAVPRNQLPQLSEDGEDGYYWSDLIGTSVVNMQGEVIGTVAGLFETGANDVVRVQLPNDKEELIPFVDQVIKQVDLKSRQITVDWELDY